MSSDVVEVTADEISTEVAQYERVPGAVLAVTPQVQASELVARLDVIKQAMQTAMVVDVDYGVIPGTDKPTLYKPGAEKLGVLFQLDVQLKNTKTWGPGDHLTVESRATVFHAPTGTRQGGGEGMCTTREKKYGKRKANRVCPHCRVEAIIKGKEEYGGGWLCWAKRDGCGAKFADGDQSIEAQEAGEVENPDLPDLWNTVVKMASKRARVDAILAVTGASALFTQDAEDLPRTEQPEAPTPTQQQSSRRQQFRQTREESQEQLPPRASEAQIALLFDSARDLSVAVITATLNSHGINPGPDKGTFFSPVPAALVDAVCADLIAAER